MVLEREGQKNPLLPTRAFHTETKRLFSNNKNMDRGMGSLLPKENLDRSNYASWSYKMHQYLLGHEYLSYVEGGNAGTPNVTHRFSSPRTGSKQSSLLPHI